MELIQKNSPKMSWRLFEIFSIVNLNNIFNRTNCLHVILAYLSKFFNDTLNKYVILNKYY